MSPNFSNFRSDAKINYQCNVQESVINGTGSKKKQKSRFPINSSYDGNGKEPLQSLVFGSLTVAMDTKSVNENISNNGNETRAKVNRVDFNQSGKVSSTLPTGERHRRRGRSSRRNGKENGGLTWQRICEKSMESPPQDKEMKSTGRLDHSLRWVNVLQDRDKNSEGVASVNSEKSTEGLIENKETKSTERPGHSLRWVNVSRHTTHTSPGGVPVDLGKSTEGPHQNKERRLTGIPVSQVNFLQFRDNSQGDAPVDFGKSTESPPHNRDRMSTERLVHSLRWVTILQHTANKSQGESPVDLGKSMSGFNVADVRITSQLAFRILGDSYLSNEGPIAEFEKFIGVASPVIMTSSVGFHSSYVPSLADVWNWYEKVGAYGLGVSVETSQNSKNRGDGRLPFLAYFVPSLSSVQLFSPVRCGEGEGSDDAEILFEFFEHERPDQRKPLCAKVKELAGGNFGSRSQTYGDPSKLEHMNLCNLHPASWYSVAWYPIYRIPQGVLRASFLTYHSLGHVAWQHTGGRATWHLVYPALGMESYNAQGEGWLKPRLGSLEGALGRRVAALGRAAAVLSRGTISRGLVELKNSHPDYEFFLSRK